MYNFVFWMSCGFVVALIYASFFEWALHRYVMHRPVGKFDYAFHAHALVHHRVFKADQTYHLRRDQDKETIPMAWWNGPILIVVSQIPFIVAARWTGNFAIVCGSLASACVYYGLYEYLHWCMHLPKARRIELSPIFYRLNGHHLLHHRYMHKNFNVVFPLADLCLGTLLLRSRIPFAQAQGPSLPDVQPKARRSRAALTST